MGLAILRLPLRSLALSILLSDICLFSRRCICICAVLGALSGNVVSRWLLVVFCPGSVSSCSVTCVCCFCCFYLVRTAPYAHHLHVYFVFSLQSQTWRCSTRGQTGCMVYVVSVPIVTWLFKALKGHGLTQIRWSTIRCALSVRPWTMTRALILGTQVDIL